MIGYMIEQELGNLLPFEKPFASLLTMVEVDPNDPAFQNPTKFVGPVYEKEVAEKLGVDFRNYRIRALLYAGKPNWDLLATITPR